jgi:regulator of cell morphogenesis and NO signaling
MWARIINTKSLFTILQNHMQSNDEYQTTISIVFGYICKTLLAMNKRKIQDIIGENYIFASVLHYFGLKFYEYSDKTLEQVCKQKGLSVSKVVESLENAVKDTLIPVSGQVNYPTDLLVEYLKHMHHVFVKQRLPYLVDIVCSCKSKEPVFGQLMDDLRFVFPLFVEDLIKHIYEEEDELFDYVLLLNKANIGQIDMYRLFQSMDKYRLQEHALEHHVHEDEMAGIRRITNNYDLSFCEDLHVKVVYSELQRFEQDLKIHAKIENEILFPKALQLEAKVKMLFQEKLPLN